MRFRSRVFVFAFAAAALMTVASMMNTEKASAQTSLLPQIHTSPKSNLSWAELTKPKQLSLKQLRSRLNPADEYATLYALQIALTRVGDGQTYIWGRPNRRLRALITPVNSYRSTDGRICRQVIFTLSLGDYLKRTEATACRATDRSWNIES